MVFAAVLEQLLIESTYIHVNNTRVETFRSMLRLVFFFVLFCFVCVFAAVLDVNYPSVKI